MKTKATHYIPALSHDWLTPLYDLLIRWTMPEYSFKRRLVEQARIKTGQRILDLGCGTATLSLIIKKTHHDTTVVGIDGDAKILEIARRKTNQAQLAITFAQ